MLFKMIKITLIRQLFFLESSEIKRKANKDFCLKVKWVIFLI